MQSPAPSLSGSLVLLSIRSVHHCPAFTFNSVAVVKTGRRGTNGLAISDFHPRIGESSSLAVERFYLVDENKITLRLDEVPPYEAALSGLTTEIVDIIKYFLRRLTPPICMVAHNGFNFDFPLLQSELRRINRNCGEFFDKNRGPIYCSDSLYLCHQFADLLSTTTDRSFALTEVYRRIFGRVFDFAHSTESDCLAMIKIVQHLGDRALEWSVYVDKNNSRESFNARKTTLKQIETFRRRGVSLFFSGDKNSHQDQKVNPKMIGGNVRADPIEVPTVMHAQEVSGKSDDSMEWADPHPQMLEDTISQSKIELKYEIELKNRFENANITQRE
ncbi:hypothetical protein ACTXT7_006503 [Hymenolepis weldensis]